MAMRATLAGMALIGLVLAVLAAGPAQARDAGLNNGSKRFTDPAGMSQADWSDPAEMARAWAAAIVRVPDGAGGSTGMTTGALASWRPKGGGKLPVVVYLHGCSGIWEGTHARLRFLAMNGFVAVAPASFARLKYPRSCDAAAHQGGLYRGTLRMRQSDAGHALEEVRKLPFADTGRIVLMGLSQGAIITATFKADTPAQRVAARVIEGWTCNAGWFEYARVNAPEDEPVLALLGADDPWFRHPPTRGSCDVFLSRTNGSRSVIYREPPLAGAHELLDHPEPRAEVLRFLKAHLRLP